ncbi:putative LuxR-family transcriptional regulator [Actinoplanes missouriensis 431]|uniref:Putative LuxR-family transcriptional regulator n=1 Tax=Actinoplanes missouriensis (strain ATCC 14538 / DSM 43046 / CBS 188.64 / JCM 3121 / NBRC 102363 / NCIMB 12654 / NRRL B-3342 / UNCC 431) TaxID=512565 RepID=I0HAR1_ACTM4|nr:putative LuxR-family transcriptional regulator [Actinoplanes missouriensis 431]
MQKLPPADRAALLRLLGDAEAGRSSALAVLGLPGAGRTTLSRIAGATGGWTVLSAIGHADETGVPCAGLHSLLTGMEDVIAELEPAPRAVLRRGLSGTSPQAERLALGLGLQTLVGTLAARRPVLCVIDDAHLFDESSWQAVRFAARRTTRFALLATLPAGADPGGLPVHHLHPLPADQARELLARHAPDLAREVADAVLERAGGNPAALIDLAGALTPAQRRGYAPLPIGLPPESPLRERFRAELEALPRPTRELLLLAAAPPFAALPDILAAATLRPGGPHPDISGERDELLADFAAAERAGLVTIDGIAVCFASPLVRGCAYTENPASRRRAAHAALARVLAGRGDVLAALLHRAAATIGPDPALAAELIRAARSAEPGAAAEARRYAADLSANPADQGAVLVDAARSAWLAGRPHDAGLLIRRVPPAAGQARVRARGLTAEMGLPDGRPGARELLLDVAAELAGTDTATALDALALAGEAAARPGEQRRYAGLAHRVVSCRRGDEPPAVTLAFHHVAGLAGMADGDEPTAFLRFRQALDIADRVADPRSLLRAATAGVLVGDSRRAAALAGRAAVLARESGATVLVPQALEMAATAGLAAGEYAAANTAALDGAALARATGQPVLAAVHSAVLAVLAALVGDRPTALSRIEAAGSGPSRALCEWALALLDLVDGRAQAAAERLARVVTAPPGYGSAMLQVAVVPHLLEAAGQAALHDALGLDAVATGFDSWAGRTGQPAWLALRDRCRALRATDAEAAESHFAQALRHTGEAGFPRAHTELLYGRLLRRRRRHVEARTHLRRATETFRLLDAEPWAAQSTRELRAAGERVDPRASALDGLELTAQQERIAVLVAGGATNREVAQELHLSPRTVDHHLRNVFARLGVRSRTEMARMLSGG